MNAAIIGATGLIGQQLLQKLIDSTAYNKIYMLGRRQASYQPSSTTEVIFIACHLDQLTTLSLPENIDQAFCCLGNTIKQAGSQDAFIAVDRTAVIDFVRLCQARANFIVTALGANSQSSTFYNRVKGETEAALESMLTSHLQANNTIAKLVFFQPSLLIGERTERRPLESFGQTIFNLISPLFIGPLKRYQPIAADKVAAAMLNRALGSRPRSNESKHQSINTAEPGVIRVNNEDML